MGSPATAMRRVALAIPRGIDLDEQQWEIRHRWIMRLLWLHAVAIAAGVAWRDPSPLHLLTDATPIPALALAARSSRFDTRARSIFAAVGLMMSSALLVHLGNGRTELHFHFFVMIGVIGLYQNWGPFLVAIGFVALHHGVMGVISPEQVFDGEAARRTPLLWAGIHAAFVLAASAVSVATWQIIERGNQLARAELESSERRFRALIENANDVVTLLGPEGEIVYDSPSVEAVLGFAAGSRLGMPGLDVVHPDDLAIASAVISEAFAQPGHTCRIEARARHRDGSWVWIDAALTNLIEDPAVGAIVVNFRDITERKALEAELAHHAFHDVLTGLANRALLLDRVEHVVERSRRDGGQIALLFLDLDDFKNVNDALGHEAGDDILRAVATRIETVLRPGDTASRLGGDEFAVLLEDSPDPATVYAVGARLLEVIQAPVETAGTSVAVNGSVGVVISKPGDDAAALLRNADLAMYRAKAQGKGCVEVYEPGMHAAAVERMELKADIGRGLDSGEFVPWYQPIVDLGTGRIIGIEALARWHHHARGTVPPISFISLAEETGQIVEIGRSILRQACADFSAWTQQLGPAAPATISVNASPVQLQHETFVDDVRNALADSGLTPGALLIEITESALVDDGGTGAAVLRELDAMGVKLVLDDFGTGYSSLSYLERFPVHALKIDKCFVDEMSPLVGLIVSLAHQLGLPVTAEGIEQEQQVDALRAMACDQGQGYLFARPAPAQELLGILRATSAAGVSVD